MNYIGIDPGKAGGIAVIKDDGSTIAKHYKPELYREVLIEAVGDDPDNCIAVVEDVHAMPGNGVTSMFSFGENKGFIEGLLFAYGIKTVLVSPQKWKRFFGLTFMKGADKAKVKRASCDKAKKIFKLPRIRATARCKVDHDGMAEALLMAEYARQNFK